MVKEKAYIIDIYLKNYMENLSKKSAVIVTAALDKVLNVEANTTSCYFAYQPKAPKELKQFRRDK